MGVRSRCRTPLVRPSRRPRARQETAYIALTSAVKRQGMAPVWRNGYRVWTRSFQRSPADP